MTADPVSSAAREPGRLGRGTAAVLLAVGTTCLLGALAVAGGVAAVLIDALASGAGGDGGCMGALALPFLLLVGSAGLGIVGATLAVGGGVIFWRLAEAGTGR
jgi:hypothetical protein